jgi:hypothetical protein
MDADALLRKMLDLVQAATFTDADEEFVSAGLAMKTSESPRGFMATTAPASTACRRL